MPVREPTLADDPAILTLLLSVWGELNADYPDVVLFTLDVIQQYRAQGRLFIFVDTGGTLRGVVVFKRPADLEDFWGVKLVATDKTLPANQRLQRFRDLLRHFYLTLPSDLMCEGTVKEGGRIDNYLAPRLPAQRTVVGGMATYRATVAQSLAAL